ncbi:ABC-2 type transporter [Singulisphaera sp. GP187]|uniref:ABC transporter permease n=1 Tax=Singulisphaera sp. GP187 TaxID=1882752 RepID=UPI00092B9F5D|nr:ABC transporter permease [Singulisphaera sp. GP187]SIO56551.1 ABC-2 type transporter [Singulisphaera sp. GP187]
MNWQHLQAVVWLRWRLLMNEYRRAGALNAVVMMIVLVGALATAIPAVITCFIVGTYLIPKATPTQLLYAWDGVLLGFLLTWGIGVLMELQRSDPLSLSKLLHLPISANGAFLINYLSSLLRLSLIVCAPLMLGFSLALISVKGVSLLPVLPLLAAFLLMVTALTYQFQGWLASLMSNPRRRRTIIMTATMLFVLIVQLPNLINLLSPWGVQRHANQSAALSKELGKLEHSFKAKEFDAPEYLARQQEVIQNHKLGTEQANRETMKLWEKWARLVNTILPIGWLPLGVMAAAEGRFLPSILGLLGMTLIGLASLWRAYGTTIALYQGQPTNRKGRPAPEPAVAPTAAMANGQTQRASLLETRIPGLSEPVSAIALGGFRSLLRSPEAKMTLLTPLITGVIFGSMLWNQRHVTPEPFRPLIAIVGMLFVLLGVLQLAGNQFGFDRDGFRVFVLSAAPRRDILLGKNLAFAPITLGMSALLLAAVQVLCPMRLDHFLAIIPQFISMFLLFCVFTNLMSIYTPIYIAAGSLKPSNPKLSTILLQLVMFMLLFPLTQAPTLLPLGAEALSKFLGWTENAPVFLALALAECAVVVLFYRVSLGWLGRWFQAREQIILETVTNRAP